MILLRSDYDEEWLARMLIILGWILPVLIVIPYTVYRAHHENNNCWMDAGWANIFYKEADQLQFILKISTYHCGPLSLVEAQ